jgi:hypothetical protein
MRTVQFERMVMGMERGGESDFGEIELRGVVIG